MIAIWMLYCVLCACGLALAAVLAEHALLSGRGPVRGVWIASVMLSIAIPVAAYRFASPSSDAGVSVAAVAHDASPDAVSDATPVTGPSASTPTRAVATTWYWRAAAERANRPLATGWLLLSVALGLNVLGGVVALAWMRRRWARRDVLGVPVYVSEHTGPAVVGMVSPAIVVPEWALAMDERHLELMLRHEQEHQRAGDGRLLAAAHIAAIVMPWNLALWWQILRLRVAVELDCDARVLRDGDVRSYGDLLLKVARPQHGPTLIGATSFAERAQQLERRIRVLARHRSRTPRMARALVTALGLAAVSAAWAAPRPPVPASVVPVPMPLSVSMTQASADPLTLSLIPLPTVGTQQRATPATRFIPRRASDGRVTVELPTARVTASSDSGHIPFVLRLAGPCNRLGADIAPLVDSAFARLFDGIALTSDQEVIACDALIKLQREQSKQDGAVQLTNMANQTKRALIEAQRNAALRELLPNDADRAVLDAHLAQAAGGGRGRSGGAASLTWTVRGANGGLATVRGDSIRFRPMDSTVVPVIISDVRGGAGGGGRGGGRSGGAGPDPTWTAAEIAKFEKAMEERMAGALVARLFDGITLTPEQEASARALMAKAQEDIASQLERPVRRPAYLRLNPAFGNVGGAATVSMQAESAAALMGLMTNDADRAKLQSRIVIIPQLTRTPGI